MGGVRKKPNGQVDLDQSGQATEQGDTRESASQRAAGFGVDQVRQTLATVNQQNGFIVNICDITEGDLDNCRPRSVSIESDGDGYYRIRIKADEPTRSAIAGAICSVFANAKQTDGIITINATEADDATS